MDSEAGTRLPGLASAFGALVHEEGGTNHIRSFFVALGMTLSWEWRGEVRGSKRLDHRNWPCRISKML